MRFVGRRVQEIASCVPSFYTVSQLSVLRKTHNCTPYAKWGVVNPESSLERNLYSSLVLRSGRVKTSTVVLSLCIHKGLNSFFQCTKLKMKFYFNLCTILASPVGYAKQTKTPVKIQ